MVGVAGRGVCKKQKGGGEGEERKLAMMRVVEVGVGGQEGVSVGREKVNSLSFICSLTVSCY